MQGTEDVMLSFPRLYAAASLKHAAREGCPPPEPSFSAALCRGLIEALPAGNQFTPMESFPRLYAAASLKQKARKLLGRGEDRFPRLYAAASLKHHPREHPRSGEVPFSAALCRGLIEAMPP